MRARYFKGGEFNDMPLCYIAQIGDYYAHGETKEKAISDARFKQMQATMDVGAVVQSVRDAGQFTRETFRLLTGACEMGVEGFLRDNDLADKDTLSIAETVKITNGAYGGEVVRRYFADMKEVA